MAPYLDVHRNPPDGATAADFAEAHKADVGVPERYGVRYLHDLVDEDRGKVFGLIEASNADAAQAVHRETRGVVADEIYPRRTRMNVQEFDAGGSQARGLGSAFLEALAAREFGVARALLADDVRFRMLVPSGLMTEENAEATMGRFIAWFANADRFKVEASTADEVAGRAAIVYRFRLHDADGWRLIEQHVMLDSGDDGRVTAIDLLCSGFRSIATSDPDGEHHFDAGDLGCADGLAGEFRRHIQQIPAGHVLVVSTRDAAAKEDLPPLARLMGHVVRSIEALGDGRLLVRVERGR